MVDIFLNKIKSDLNKIKVDDGSMNIENHDQLILDFFEKKIRNNLESVKSQANSSYNFVDLFCGAGGLSLGLEQSGLIPITALDKDYSSLQTYHFNRPFFKASQIINDDIRNVISNYQFPKVPLIVGGPPCQGFSNANKQRKEDDERNQLYKFYVHTVEECKPDIFLLENVEGIMQHLNFINSDFEKIKYTLFPFVLNTKDFGFPQNRKRVFIFGFSNNHSRIFSEFKTIIENIIQENYQKGLIFNLWDSIFDLPKVKAKTISNSTYTESKEWGYTYGRIGKKNTPYSNLINQAPELVCPTLNHKTKYNNSRDISIYGLLKPGEGSESESIKKINPYHSRKNIFKDKFFKLLPEEPSKTITAHMYYDCHMYIHPFEARGLTPREAARIQGFPDDYLFLGTPNEWYRQIGNAVSPLMARVIGEALKKLLDRIYEK